MSSDIVYSTQLCILPQNFPIFFFYHILHRTISVDLFVFFFWMYVYEICHNTEIFKLAPFLDLFVVCFLKFNISFLTYTDTRAQTCAHTHTLDHSPKPCQHKCQQNTCMALWVVCVSSQGGYLVERDEVGRGEKDTAYGSVLFILSRLMTSWNKLTLVGLRIKAMMYNTLFFA